MHDGTSTSLLANQAIRLATPTNELAGAVARLRAGGYRDLFGRDPGTPQWDALDDTSACLVAMRGDAASSTLTATLFDDADTLSQRYLDGNPCPRSVDAFPVCAFRRAATTPAATGSGFLSLLRWHLYAAMLRTPVRFIVGSVPSEPRRLQYFRDLGYATFEEPYGWPEGPLQTSTIVLDLHRVGDAILTRLEPVVRDLKSSWPLADPIDTWLAVHLTSASRQRR